MRHVTSIEELSRKDLTRICELATAPIDDELLKGQGVALLFERPSLRTRASSAVAVHELGGFATFFSDEEIGIDSRESAEDVARTLAEMYAIAGARVRDHGVFARMKAATNDRLSFINLLSDQAHPTQAIADVLTIADEFSKGDVKDLAGLTVTYVGDATNVTRSLTVALMKLGVHVRIGAPAEFQLAEGGLEDPRLVSGKHAGSLTLFDDALEASKGADVLYTDAWVSMGAEDDADRRKKILAPFQVNAALVSQLDKNAIVMHCLPAHRNDEITDDVIDGKHTRVWREVHHRRSAMLGALRWIKEEKA